MKLLKYALGNLHLIHQMSFYAVARGHAVGVYESWPKCEAQVKGFKGARYKKFPTRTEAESFIKEFSLNDSGEILTKHFSPKDAAIALGSKNKKVPQKQEEKQPEIVKREAVEDYWPESDGDSFDETTDAELLTVLTALEEKPKQSAPQKRKLNETATTSSRSKIPKHASKVWEAVGEKRIGCYQFSVDMEDFVIVYTDGSCINNGQANASAGYGVYFGDEHPLNAAKPVHGRVTNNVGEIQASIHAIEVAKDMGIDKLCISTDSQFLINAITNWIYAWKRKNWRLKNGEPVKNVDDFRKLDALLQDNTLAVKWNYVKAHKGIKGNEMADKLARAGSDIYKRMHQKETKAM